MFIAVTDSEKILRRELMTLSKEKCLREHLRLLSQFMLLLLLLLHKLLCKTRIRFVLHRSVREGSNVHRVG